MSVDLRVRLGEDHHLGARPVACRIGLRLEECLGCAWGRTVTWGFVQLLAAIGLRLGRFLGVHGCALESEIAWGCLVSLQALPPSAPQAKAPPSDVKVS